MHYLFLTLDFKQIVSLFCDALMDNLSVSFQTNVLSWQTIQYMWEWTPRSIYEGGDAFLSEGTLAILCTALYLYSIGAVHFIGILLLIAGIEPNPGPNIRHILPSDSNVSCTIDEHHEEMETNGSPEVHNSAHIYPVRSEEL